MNIDLGGIIGTISEVGSHVSPRKVNATPGAQMWDTIVPKTSSGNALTLSLLWVMTHATEAKPSKVGTFLREVLTWPSFWCGMEWHAFLLQ